MGLPPLLFPTPLIIFTSLPWTNSLPQITVPCRKRVICPAGRYGAAGLANHDQPSAMPRAARSLTLWRHPAAAKASGPDGREATRAPPPGPASRPLRSRCLH